MGKEEVEREDRKVVGPALLQTDLCLLYQVSEKGYCEEVRARGKG